mmetsp:Transcript_39945/g.78545  ORF Transcript_39945/g.78545 Transcript_39945/m.78545 type:complete len:265 (+) Transcript_39945:3274-4068(+)
MAFRTLWTGTISHVSHTQTIFGAREHQEVAVAQETRRTVLLFGRVTPHLHKGRLIVPGGLPGIDGFNGRQSPLSHLDKISCIVRGVVKVDRQEPLSVLVELDCSSCGQSGRNFVLQQYFVKSEAVERVRDFTCSFCHCSDRVENKGRLHSHILFSDTSRSHVLFKTGERLRVNSPAHTDHALHRSADVDAFVVDSPIQSILHENPSTQEICLGATESPLPSHQHQWQELFSANEQSHNGSSTLSDHRQCVSHRFACQRGVANLG